MSAEDKLLAMGASLNFGDFKYPCFNCKKNKKGVAYCRGIMRHTDADCPMSQADAMREHLAQTADA